MKDLQTKIITADMNLQEIIKTKMAKVEALEINKVCQKVTTEVKERCYKNTTTDFNRNGLDFDQAGFNRQELAIRAWERDTAEDHIKQLR